MVGKKNFFILSNVIILSIVVGVLLISSAVEAKSFKIGYFKLEPHAISANQGAAVEYFKIIARKMNLTDVSFVDLPLSRLIPGLESGELDMILLLGKNPEREAKFVFPQEPLFKMQPSLAVKSSQSLKEIKSVQDILPLKIGIWQGGYYSPMIKDNRLKLEPMSGDDVIAQNYKKIVAGRVDAFFCPDAYALKYEVRKGNYSGQIKVVTLPDEPVGLYAVFSKKSAAEYKRTYEKALQDTQKEKPYKKFLDSYLEK